MAEVINPAIVPKVTLPSGEQVPCVGMGTFGSDRVSAEDVSAAVAGAIRSGYRMFDCAACYGNEHEIGQVFKDGVRDKLAAIAVDKGVQPVIVCTKGDLAEAEFLRKAYERSTLPFIRIDYETGGGLDEVKQWIGGRLCAFCGNSGVGKSTLLNHLLPEAERETSAISQKLGRGRHTTREVTIFEAFGGRIADTPGFASLEANRAGFIPKENLEHAFPEFGPYLGQCQFTGCSHRSEKGCAVRAALAEGRLSQTRYDSYCAMYEEVKDVKDWQRPKV